MRSVPSDLAPLQLLRSTPDARDHNGRPLVFVVVRCPSGAHRRDTSRKLISVFVLNLSQGTYVPKSCKLGVVAPEVSLVSCKQKHDGSLPRNLGRQSTLRQREKGETEVPLASNRDPQRPLGRLCSFIQDKTETKKEDDVPVSLFHTIPPYLPPHR